MEVTFCEEHFAALAARLKGEATCSLLVGDVTVMVANAGAAVAARRQSAPAVILGKFMADLQFWEMCSLRVCTCAKHSGVLEGM
jgi:hypothetical protein